MLAGNKILAVLAASLHATVGQFMSPLTHVCVVSSLPL